MEFTETAGPEQLSPELLESITALGVGVSPASSSEDSEDERVQISIGTHQIYLRTAENDFNKDKKTLFATHIWTGSKTLSTYIAESIGADAVRGTTVLEFGAGAGLPSILCARLGAQFVCSSDYPSDSVLENLQQNINYNIQEESGRSKIRAVGYIWGEDPQPVLALNGGGPFDFVIMSECLWRHEQHRDLVWSIKRLLKETGKVVLTYSHHIPGAEMEDDGFFEIAATEGFEIVQRLAVPGKHMWRKDDDVDIFVVELIKRT